MDSEFDYNKKINLDEVEKLLAIHEIGEALIGDITPFDGITVEQKKEMEHKAIINVIGNLDNKNEFSKIKEIYEKIGYKVIETSSKNKVGIDKLKEALKNNINAFSGNSGVGKSTLINEIFEGKVTLEGEISKKNKRGKNTTTSVKLYEIDKDTYIADTPRIFNI